MLWSFKFWRDRLGHDLSAERRRLLGECLPLPLLARLDVPQGEVLAPTERLKVGDRVLVSAGEVVPADGRVFWGEGIVDEQAVRGLNGASRVRAGDSLLAGSTVLAGSLSLTIEQTADGTRAYHNEAGHTFFRRRVHTRPASSPTRRAEAFAERAVGPTIAIAGLGLLSGDLTTAAAILRPDYATGPGISAPMEMVRDATACARLGIVVRSPDAFDRLAIGRIKSTQVASDDACRAASGRAWRSVRSRRASPSRSYSATLLLPSATCAG